MNPSHTENREGGIDLAEMSEIGLAELAEALRREKDRRILAGLVIPPAGMPAIVASVAERHRLRLDEIMGCGRHQEVSRARQEAFWRCRQSGKSFPQIARFFSRDHTTVLHGVRQHERRLAAG